MFRLKSQVKSPKSHQKRWVGEGFTEIVFGVAWNKSAKTCPFHLWFHQIRPLQPPCSLTVFWHMYKYRRRGQRNCYHLKFCSEARTLSFMFFLDVLPISSPRLIYQKLEPYIPSCAWWLHNWGALLHSYLFHKAKMVVKQENVTWAWVQI